MNQVHDLVSAIIPTYNYGRFVVDAVQSALAQTYRSMEVIVVDDGSTDDTQERLKPYQGRIRVIRQENQGLSAARNTGIRNARGEWIALLDADDVWHPDKLQRQLAAVADRPDIALVGSPATDDLTRPLEADPSVAIVGVRELLLTSRMGPSSAMIRRSAFETVGYFDESLRSVEDRDMWLRLASKYPCAIVNSRCWWYRHHPMQMSRNAARMYYNYRRVLANFFDQHPEHKPLRRMAMGYMYADAAWAYVAEERKFMALWRLCQSAWHRPLTLGDELKTSQVRLKFAGRIVAGSVLNAVWRHT